MKTSSALLLLLLVCFSLVSESTADTCPNTAAAGNTTKPLYLLSLVSMPDGLYILPGHRIAQQEINNRSDILPGYRIELIVDSIETCSSSGAGIGLSNLLKHTLKPSCRPVVAVAGLGCSSHTSVVSPVAGHRGMDLIQLSSANSPLFDTQDEQFPHLWRFAGSASVYSDAVIAILKQYKWERIGIVFNPDSLFHFEMARHLQQAVSKANKTVEFFVGVAGTRDVYLRSVIFNIKNRQTTIIVSLLSTLQTAAFFNFTKEMKVTYPTYVWIHIEKLHSYFLDLGDQIDVDDLVGSIYLHIQTEVTRNQTELVSGETFASFRSKYAAELSLISSLYNISRVQQSSISRALFVSSWYDQMWAIALALNNSLPILEHRNLSIDEYTIGQASVTGVIEEQLAKLKFQGAAGRVEFNKQRSVLTSVEVFWIAPNATEILVGLYNPLSPENFNVSINSSELPTDTLELVNLYHLISLPIAIVLYVLTGIITVFTTIQMVLYLYYKDHKVIMATSPYLSLLMFAGCYMLCFCAFLSISQDSFVLKPVSYTALTSLVFILSLNAISLILTTLFVKLLRVQRIFSSKLVKDLGKYWSNGSLLFIIVLLTLALNIMMIPVMILETPTYSNYTVEINKTHVEIHIRPLVRGSLYGMMFIFTYIILFLLVISCLAVRTRKIRHKNFKDTKKINILIAFYITISFFSLSLFGTFSQTQQEIKANISLVSGLLLFPALCQLVLFTPKILPILLEKHFINPVALYRDMLHLLPCYK